MSTKVSSKNTEAFIKKMRDNGIDEKTIDKMINELEDEQVVSSTGRGSIQFEDADGNHWRASLTWKSVEGNVDRKDSESMIKMKEHFEKGKSKFGEMVK